MRTIRGSRTLPCDNTVFDKARVKWNTAQTMLTLCGPNDTAIGIVDGVPKTQSGLGVTNYPQGLCCTVISAQTEDGVSMISAGAIGLNAPVYAAALGTIAATGTLLIGYNNTAGITAAGQVCDVQPIGNVAISPTSVVAAAGTNQATAAALSRGYNYVTGATGVSGTGVILPTGVDGLGVDVDNDDTANAILLVYPDTGHGINAGSANAAYQLAAKGATRFTYVAGTINKWTTMPKTGS